MALIASAARLGAQECSEYARKNGAVDDKDFVKLIQKQRGVRVTPTILIGRARFLTLFFLRAVIASEKRRMKKLAYDYHTTPLQHTRALLSSKTGPNVFVGYLRRKETGAANKALANLPR